MRVNKKEPVYTPDSGLTGTYSALADGRPMCALYCRVRAWSYQPVLNSNEVVPVSYTHLTLPTILRV